MDYSESSDVIVTCVSQQLSSQEGQSRKPTASRQKSSYGGYLHPKAAEFGSNFDWNESQYSMMFSPSNFTSTSPSSLFEHKSPKGHNIQFLNPDTCKTSETFTCKTSGIDDMSKLSKNENQMVGIHSNLTSGVQSSQAKGKSEAKDSRKLDSNQRRQSQLRYSSTGVSLGGGHQQAGATNATSHKSCDHTHTSVQAEAVHRASLPIDLNQSGSELNLKFSQEETTKSFSKRSSSVIYKGNQGAAMYRNSVNYSVIKLDSLHMLALKKIQNSSWYPKDQRTQLQGDSEELTEVVNTLSK